MTSETVVTSALLDLARAAALVGASWALVGGQALIAYGVPRETLDADALVDHGMLGAFADVLVDTFGWTPVVYDEGSEDYVESADVAVHFMDDPVLFDVAQERQMVPLRSPLGLPPDFCSSSLTTTRPVGCAAAGERPRSRRWRSRSTSSRSRTTSPRGFGPPRSGSSW